MVRTGVLFILALSAWCSLAYAIPEGPSFPSAAWTLREQGNFQKTTEAPLEQANPAFALRLSEQTLINEVDWLDRALSDPSWLALKSGNTPVTPNCNTWEGTCAGDPFRYPDAEGLDGDSFYANEAEVVPVLFYDQECARLSGRIWAPRDSSGKLAGVVIENGSALSGPETSWWWAAQALVRAGYVVMTFDPRSQSRSDMLTPEGEPGSNLNPPVFATNLVDAIDFFRSSEDRPYPHNLACQGSYPTEMSDFNPLAERLDPDRLGIAGHSLGAQSVMKVQAYDAPGAAPWPGLLDDGNPVDVAVAWDSGSNPQLFTGGISDPLLHDVLVTLLAFPVALNPRVPLMSQQSEYGLAPTTFLLPPKPDSHKVDYAAWSAKNMPVYQFTIRGSTHMEWSSLPGLPTTSWCPTIENGRCAGGWGNPMAEYYTVAWFDRWLKVQGEPGFCDADRRLLADADWRDRYSFYFRSARRFPDRNGVSHDCGDIRAGCQDTAVEDSPTCKGNSSNDGGLAGEDQEGPNPAAGGCSLTLRKAP